MSTKLKLTLDQLEVDSFHTVPVKGIGLGTVRGAQQCTCPTACTCPGCPTCDNTCPYTCDDYTCANCTYDVTCPDTCAKSCYTDACECIFTDIC